MKTYYIQHGIGKCKYLLSYSDGAKTHNDGSLFFDVKIFRQQAKMIKFIKCLEAKGYQYK